MIYSDRQSVPVSLPQCGFSTDVEFDKLVKNNHFLFRVYTPKPSSPFSDHAEPFFVAPVFDERWNHSPEELARSPLSYEVSDRHVGTYEDVATHMDFLTKSSSPYVSASFSFTWSIWEALRRYHLGVKKNIEIAVIDASAVSHRAATAIQLLQARPSSRVISRRAEHWKWYRYAQESQSVLVYGYVSASAVLSSIPLVSLLEKLPCYFFRQEISESSKGLVLASLAWDYTEKKRNFLKFCQKISSNFLQSSEYTRLEATTAGSVRLAMAFLRPWFHRYVVDDFQTATITLCALAFNIAQWPGQWWAQEHSELWNLIRAMVLSLAEEVRKDEGVHHSKEVTRLQGVIVELEDAVEKYKKEIKTRKVRRPAQLLTPLLIPPLLHGTSTDSTYRTFLSTSERAARPSPMKTPITPPTSPIRPRHRQSFLPHVDSSITNPENASHINRNLPAEIISMPAATTNLTPSPSESPQDEITFVIEPPSSIEPQSPLPSPVLANHLESVHPVDALSEDRDDAPVRDVAVSWQQQKGHIVAHKPPTMAETASCLVTGFLIGAFITLCLLSPQRRTLLTHLT
ncbi:hypothetical protein C0992_006976 [Termitomyces sp. T32_za158]|nr:hypothetical protein C0992_006976 [Termitomyces sp. T32_za158]